jgi:hypothetical protein
VFANIISEFQISKGMPWVEQYRLKSSLPADLDPADDLKREEAMSVQHKHAFVHWYLMLVCAGWLPRWRLHLRARN